MKHDFPNIERNPEILGGKPVIKGTRISVEFILECLHHGASVSEILKHYPRLTESSVQEAISYAIEALRHDSQPLAAWRSVISTCWQMKIFRLRWPQCFGKRAWCVQCWRIRIYREHRSPVNPPGLFYPKSYTYSRQRFWNAGNSRRRAVFWHRSFATRSCAAGSHDCRFAALAQWGFVAETTVYPDLSDVSGI